MTNLVGLSLLRLLSPQELVEAFLKHRERAVDFARYVENKVVLNSEKLYVEIKNQMFLSK